MAARKILETMSGMILNRLQPKFAAKSVANEMRPVRGNGVCSHSNQTAQRLQMAARKSFETMSGMIQNRLQPKFAAKLVANEMRPARGKGVCSDSNHTAQRPRMAARKSLETMSGMILNRFQPKFAAKSVANEMLCLKA